MDGGELRAGDADRERVAECWRTALDEGRLHLHEYDEWLRDAYAAKTHAELDKLLMDLPGPTLDRRVGRLHGHLGCHLAVGRRADLFLARVGCRTVGSCAAAYSPDWDGAAPGASSCCQVTLIDAVQYFPDVQAVLTGWHERQLTAHLDRLTDAADPAAPAVVRLEAVLHTYAHIQHHSARHHGGELATLLHGSEHVNRAQQRLREFVQVLIAEAAQDGALRDDVATDELTSYCLHALTAAGAVRSADGVQRLVAVTMAGLTPVG